MRLYLTRSGEDGVRVATYLARAGGRVSSRQIAEATAIPPGQIPTIMASLSRAGILLNRSGAGGGCELARPAEQVTVLDVVQAIEGPVARDACVLDRSRPHREWPCALHDAWMRAEEAVVEALASATIADLAEHPQGLALPTTGHTPPVTETS